MKQLKINNLRIVAISDTHGQHRKLQIPDADVIIHLGDACEGGDEDQLRDFFQWFSGLPVAHKLFVAGNHDLPFDLDPGYAMTFIPNNVELLENSEVIIEGVRFYGLVARPWLFEMTSIPDKVDVLITHGPPLGILDENIGCPILYKVVKEAKPEYHLFGHIHSEGERCMTEGSTTFCNVSDYLKVN